MYRNFCAPLICVAMAVSAAAQARTGTGALPLPTVTAGATSISLSWTTSQRLNTQVWYGPPGGGSSHFANWKLVTAHAVTLSGLAAGATYSLQAESSNYSNPDLFSPLFTVTLGGGTPPPPVLQLAPAAATLTIGDTLTLIPSYTNGQPVGALTWSASNGGQISPAGVFTASAAGTFVVTASDTAGLSAQSTLTVSAPAATGLPPPAVTNLTQTGFTLTWTTSQPLNTQVHYSAPGGRVQTLANWKLVTAHVATLTGLSAATAYSVTTESSFFSDPDLFSPAFTVSTAGAAPPPPALNLSPSAVTLAVGATQAFTASYSNGQPVGPLAWLVNNSGSIAPDGTFTASAAGSFTVTATDTASGLSATAQVTVSAAPPPPPPALSIIPPDPVLFTGATLTFAAVNSAGTPAAVTWSATNGGSVDPDSGLFTASTPGSFTLTATSAAGAMAMTTLTVIAPAPPPAAAACPGCFFTSPAAAWLYAGPNPAWGLGRDLSALTAAWAAPSLNTNNTGFGMPVQHTDGSFGTTAMNDYNYGPGWRHDSAVVPNPPNNQWTVSCGWLPPSLFGQTSCYGAYDGKDFIINDSTGDYFDIDQLYVNATGHPINFGDNGYGTGLCGAPGETVCGVRGIFSGNLATSDPAAGGSTAIGIVSGAGTIVPGELDCPTCLNHAVQIASTDPITNTTTCNAVPANKAGDGNRTLPAAVLCEGGVLWYSGDWTQLDPATHSPAVIALARALALYGGVITDQGGPNLPTFSFYTAYNTPPALTGISDLLRHLVIFYGAATLK